MARPNKSGLDYYPMDVDFFQDPKLQFIRAKCGFRGEWIIIRLWSAIYRSGYYIPWSEDDQLLFSKNLNEGISLNQLSTVVTEAIKRELFSERQLTENTVLTSKGIQERYLRACTDSRRKNTEINPKYNLLIHKHELNTTETGLMFSESTQREREIEKEIEKEIERENFYAIDFKNFLKIENIKNSESLEFLSSEAWFEAKAMQLQSDTNILVEKAKEFLTDLRDRDMIEGKNLTDLKIHFVSWFKKKRDGPTYQAIKKKYPNP